MARIALDFQQTHLRPSDIDAARATQQISEMVEAFWSELERRLRLIYPDEKAPREISLCQRFVDITESQQLNSAYRGRDGPTNVLSFVAGVWDDQNSFYLGDLAICSPLICDEAMDQKKRIADHYLHLTLHGILHLVGYDHETKSDALEMESLETKMLGTIGIKNPYEAIGNE